MQELMKALESTKTDLNNVEAELSENTLIAEYKAKIACIDAKIEVCVEVLRSKRYEYPPISPQVPAFP